MRAAIIGIGAIAKMHARALRDIPGVQLVAATCRTEEKGRAFATEFGCQWHADTARMLRREKPDFVTVATPSGAHLPAVIAALRRGVSLGFQQAQDEALQPIALGVIGEPDGSLVPGHDNELRELGVRHRDLDAGVHPVEIRQGVHKGPAENCHDIGVDASVACLDPVMTESLQRLFDRKASRGRRRRNEPEGYLVRI